MSETFEPETGEMIVKRVSVPMGLEELMEGLTKEVLLKKPDDIYLFAADYFARLLLLREKGSYKAKTLRNVQSVAKQTPKQPLEKLLIRGASKQLSRQISIRGESPTKRVAPIKRVPPRIDREDKGTERNKFIERRRARKAETTESKNVESKTKQVSTTPRPTPGNTEEKLNTLNQRDRSLSTSRRGRSTNRNVQSTPRQKSTSTPRKAETPSDKSNRASSRSEDKQKVENVNNKKEKHVVPHISSIEENQEFIKDNKLTVTTPQIIKHPQVVEKQELISSIVVPQTVGQIGSFLDNNDANHKKDLQQVHLHETDTINVVGTAHEQQPEEETGDKKEKSPSLKRDSIVRSEINESDSVLIKTNDDKNKDKGDSNSSYGKNETQQDLIIKDRKIPQLGDNEKKHTHSVGIDESYMGNNEKTDKDITAKKMRSANSSLATEKSILSEETDKNIKSIPSSDADRSVEESKIDGNKTVRREQEIIKKDRNDQADKLEKDSEKFKPDTLQKNMTPKHETVKEVKEAEFMSEIHKDETSKIDEFNQENKLPDKVYEDFKETGRKSNDQTVDDISESVKGKHQNVQNALEIPKEVAPKLKSEVQNDTEPQKVKDIKSGSGNDNLPNISANSYVSKSPLKEEDNIKPSSEKDIQIEKESKDKNISIDGKETEEADKSLDEVDKAVLYHETKQVESKNITDEGHAKIQNLESTVLKTNEHQAVSDKQTETQTGIGNEEEEENLKQTNKNTPDEKSENYSSDTKASLGNPTMKTEAEHGIKNLKPQIIKGETKEETNNELLATARDIKKCSEDNAFTLQTDKSVNEKETNEKEDKACIKQNIVADKNDKDTLENEDHTREENGDILEDDRSSIIEGNDKKEFDSKHTREELNQSNTEKHIPQKEIELKKQNNVLAEASYKKDLDKNKIGHLESPKHVKPLQESNHSVLTSEGNNKRDQDFKNIKSNLDTLTENKNLLQNETASALKIDQMLISEVGNKLEKDQTDTQELSEHKGLTPEKISSALKIVDAVILEKNSKREHDAMHSEDKELFKNKPIIPEISPNEKSSTQEITDHITKEIDAGNVANQSLNKINLIPEIQSQLEQPSTKKEIENKPVSPTENSHKSEEKSSSALKIVEAVIPEKNSKRDHDSMHSEEKELFKNKPIIPEISPNEKSSTQEITDHITKEIDAGNMANQSLNKINLIPEVQSQLEQTSTKKEIENKPVSSTENSYKSEPFTQSEISSSDTGKNKIHGSESGNNKSYEGSLVKLEQNDNAKLKNINMLSNGQDQTEKIECKIDDTESKTVVFDSKDSTSTDSYSDSTKIPISSSSSSSTDKQIQDISSSEIKEVSKNDEGIKEVHAADSVIEQEDSCTNLHKTNGSSEESKEKRVNESENDTDNKNIEKIENLEIKLQPHHPQNDTITSVIGVTKGGLIDHRVKRCIGDFIQNETQHVYIGESDLKDKNQKYVLDMKSGELTSEENQKEDAAVEEHISANENSNKKEKNEENGQSEEEVSKLQSDNVAINTGNIIESVINIVKDNLLNNKVKTYINNFIQNEKEYVFVEKSDNIADRQINIPKIANQQLSQKEQVEELSLARHVETSAHIDSSQTVHTEQEGVIAKEHITNFLHNEKQNVFKHSDINKDVTKEIEKEIIPIDKLDLKTDIKVTSEETNKIKKDDALNTDGKKLESGIEESDKSASTAIVEGTEKRKTKKDERKMRRIKTVDVIRDESKQKVHVKSRIPTADYRTRVKRDEDEKHSMRIKRPTSQNDNMIMPLKDNIVAVAGKSVSVIKKRDEGDTKINNANKSKKIKEDKSQDKDIIDDTTEVSSGNRVNQKDKTVERSDSKTEEPRKVQKIIEHDKFSSDGTKSHQEPKKVENEIKIIEIEKDYDAHVLPEEIKAFSNDVVSNVKSEISLKDIAAIIKIQSLWRGFKVRKNRNGHLKQQQLVESDGRIIKTDNILGNSEMITYQMTDTQLKKAKSDSQHILSDSDIKSLHVNTDNGDVGSLDKEVDYKMQNAAVVIQKNWRGFETRKHLTKEKPDKLYIYSDQKLEEEKNIKDALVTVREHTESKTVADVNILDEFNDKFVKAATIIQKIWRGFKVRKVTESNKIRDKDTDNYKRIGYLKQKEEIDASNTEILGNTSDERFKAAVVTIQKVWRGFKVRKILNKSYSKKLNELSALDNKNKTDPKSEIKKREAHIKAVNKNLETKLSESRQLTNEEKLIKAVIIIQAVWRGFQVRKLSMSQHFQLKNAKISNVNVFDSGDKSDSKNKTEDLICRQTSTENFSSKKSAEIKLLPKSEDKFIKSAILIQKIWRGFYTRNILQAKSKNIREEVKGITPEEVTTRNRIIDTPQKPLELKETRTQDEFIKAAILIQKIWRGFRVKNLLIKPQAHDSQADNKNKTTKEVKTKQVKHLQGGEEFIKAAILIQTIWRGFKVRKTLKGNTDIKRDSQNVKTEQLKTTVSAEKVMNKESESKSGDNTERNTENETTKPVKITQDKQVQGEEEFVRAAILIQTIWRGFKVRNTLKLNTNNIKKDIQNVKIEQLKAAVSKENDMNKGTKSKSADNTEKNNKNKTTDKVKSKEVKQLQGEEEFMKAAILIQKIWRGFKVREMLKKSKGIKTEIENVTTKQLKSVVSTENYMNKENKRKMKTSGKLPEDKKNEERLVKSAILIQKIWRGFNVRKNLYRNNTKNREVVEKCQAASKSKVVPTTDSGDRFEKSAIMIQKIWRGFKVRKVTQEKKLFGKPVETETPEIETVKEVSVRNKKSALKIQSLWRGYQVRKNINVIKNKLEDNIAINDAGTGRELTDGDILNAATKIQAGVRGYLQRKKYKTDVKGLNSICEEECDDKCTQLLSDNNTTTKDNEHDLDTINKKLSEEEVIKALEDLNKLEVPSEELLPPKTDKPHFYRSNTVQEPEILRKHSPLLLKSDSVGHIQGTKHDELQNSPNKDDNNNNPDDHKNLTPLETDVKEALDRAKRKLQSDEDSNLNNENTDMNDTGNEQLFENSIINIDPSNENVKKQETLLQNDVNLSQTSKINDDRDAIGLAAHASETSVPTKTYYENTNEEGLNRNKSREVRCAVKDENDKTDNYKDISDKSLSGNEIIDDDYKDGNDAEVENRAYDRPLSMDSNDSGVTVIYNGEPYRGKKNNLKSIEVNDVSDNTNTTHSNENEAFIEHETLINDYQNRILDQISGRSDSTEDTINKFDIERLRKELAEAGLIHNGDGNAHIRHENSREMQDDRDELSDYLGHFELSTEKATQSSYMNESTPNLTTRDLSDIKEEDLETKSVENTQRHDGSEVKKFTPNYESIEKIKSTLKECEDISREINMGFETIKPSVVTSNESDFKSIIKEDLYEKQSPISTLKQSEQSFCGTTENQIDNKIIPNDVELVNPVDIKARDTLQFTQHTHEGFANKGQLEAERAGEDATNQNISEKPMKGLVHTGELHDSVTLPLFKESELQDLHSTDRMNVNLSSENTSGFHQSKLLHTGELHDTIVVPLSLSVHSGLNIDREKPTNSVPSVATQELLLESNSNVTRHPKDSSTIPSAPTGLLHTGELHDTLLVPLPLMTHQLHSDSSNSLLEAADGDLKESTQKHLAFPLVSAEQDSVQSTGLLHTGELHDSVVLPMRDFAAKENNKESEDNTSNKSDTETGNTPRHVDSECQTSGDPAIAVHLNEVPAGVAALTSPRPLPVVRDVSGVAGLSTQAPDKGALPNAPGSDASAPPHMQGMESEKCTGQTTVNNNKSMEAQAATKIQAGFRGYQVRKQLKLKNGSSDINNQRRQLRRKSSGRLSETNRISQNKSKEPNELEEKSAVKIQAGVRGFLVRRRQKKQKKQES